MLIIPDNVKVGFQKRRDALTDVLGFVTYPDKKGWKQSIAWERWRNSEIEPLMMDNTPKRGYVINKSLKHHPFSSFGQVRTKVRVHCPDGFEIEISTENLIEILEVADISKKYINCDCVLGWFGNEIWLIPIETKIYKDYLKDKEDEAKKKAFEEANKANKVKKNNKTDAETLALRKENKKSLKVGDVFFVEPNYVGKQEYLYVGKYKMIDKSFIKGLTYKDVVKTSLVKDIPECDIFMNITRVKKMEILSGHINTSHMWAEALIFNSNKVLFETKREIFTKVEMEAFKDKVCKHYENLKFDNTLTVKRNNSYMATSFKKNIEGIYEKLMKKLSNNDEKTKARMVVLEKVNETNTSFNLGLIEIEGVKIGKNSSSGHGYLALELIVNVLDKETLNVIASYPLSVGEHEKRDFYKKVKNVVKPSLKMFDDSFNLVIKSAPENIRYLPLNLKEEAVNFKVEWL